MRMVNNVDIVVRGNLARNENWNASQKVQNDDTSLNGLYWCDVISSYGDREASDSVAMCGDDQDIRFVLSYVLS